MVVPVKHAVHCDDDDAPLIDENVPSAQARHDKIEFAPIMSDHVPATHDTQLSEAASEDHVPAAHAIHADDASIE